MTAHVVVLGTGSIGQRHLRVAQALGLAPVALPVGRSSGSRPELADFRLARSWDEASNLADEAHLTKLAVIATSTSRHLIDATEAVERGFDVLVEKPLAPTSDGIAALAARAAALGRRVFVGCNLRFSRGFAVVEEKLGALGRVYSARVECQSYLPSWRPGTDHTKSYAARRDEGGVTRDLVHEIDYTCALLGAPAALFARFDNTGELGLESEESCDMSWVAAHGAVVSMRLDYLSRVRRRRALFVGERGELEWDAHAHVVTSRSAEGEARTIDVAEDRDDTMKAQLDAALRASRGGAPGRLATLDDGAVAVAVIDAAHASAASRREEPVLPWRSR